MWTRLARTAVSSPRLLSSRRPAYSSVAQAQTPVRVAVIGIGAIGSLLCASLSKASTDPQFSHLRLTAVTHRERQATEIRRRGGITVERVVDNSKERNKNAHIDSIGTRLVETCEIDSVISVEEDRRRALEGSADEERGGEGEVDIAIITVKHRSTRQVAKYLQSSKLLAPSAVVYTLQNAPSKEDKTLTSTLGLENAEILQEVLGDRVFVLQGVTYLGGVSLGPGDVHEAGIGQTIIEQGGDKESAYRGELLARALTHAGYPCTARPSSDVQAILWAKLLVNCAINPLTAILRVRNGQLALPGPHSQVIKDVIGEVIAVAEAQGITPALSEDPYEYVMQVARTTGKNTSSMLKDILDGRRTEIDAINGAVARLGEVKGVATPVNSTLTALVHYLEQNQVKLTAAPSSKLDG